VIKGNGGLLYPKYYDPQELAVPVVFRKDVPKLPFNITFDLDGETIGKFFYEDKQLKFEGDVDESAQIWIDWVIAKFMEWHDEHIR
jgi:hypothetical protein